MDINTDLSIRELHQVNRDITNLLNNQAVRVSMFYRKTDNEDLCGLIALSSKVQSLISTLYINEQLQNYLATKELIKELSEIKLKKTYIAKQFRQEIKKTKELCLAIIQRILTVVEKNDMQEMVRNHYLSQPNQVLELTIRSTNALNAANLLTIGDICKKSKKEIAGLNNVGEKSAQEIIAAIEALDLTLRD